MLILMRTQSISFVSSLIFCLNVRLNVFFMKWKILSSGYLPCFKCGAEVAAGIGAGFAGLMGSLYSNDVSSSNVNRQLAAQREENQLNRDWQTAEAEKARQFSAQQQAGSFSQVQQLQSQQQQYNLQSMAQQAKYNSPVWQRHQLELAGLNPQVYFGSQSSFGGSSAQSGGAPSAPAPAHASMPGSVSGLSPVGFQPQALDVAVLGNVMKNFAEAKKLGIEADWLPRTLQAEIMNKKSYSDLNSALKLGAQINNELQNAKVPYAIKQAAADVAKTISEAELNDERKLTEQSQQKVNDSLKRLNDSLQKLNSKEYERYGIYLHYYENMLQEQLNNLRSDTGFKAAQTQTENEFRSTRGAILGLEYALKNNEVEVSNSTVKAAILSALQKAVQEKWHTKEAYTDYLIKQYKLDTQGVKDAMRILTGWIPFAPGLSD